MGQGSFRLVIAVAALAVLWVVVYWWTPPPRPASVALDLPTGPHLPPTDAAPTDEPAARSPALAVDADLPVIPPSFYEYHIQRGDTAQSISRRIYGTTRHWQAVMKANPKTDFQHLRVGMTVRVPVDPANVQGTPAPTPDNRPDIVPSPPAGAEYVVARGDTLTGLAQRFYGRASLWRRILDANRAALGDDASRLRAGMRLIIPPAPSR